MNSNHTALLRSITQGVWYVDQASVDTYLPLAIKVLKGEDTSMSSIRQPLSFFRTSGDVYEKILLPQGSSVIGLTKNNTATALSDSEQEELVAVYPLQGIITKYDQNCGPDGVLTLLENMKAMDRDSRVIAHVLDIDSGGGEASIIDTISAEINRLEKPVISYFNSVAASAAYYIASATQEIYASEATDLVGSIGTMVTFADFTEMYKKEGIKIHEVYADQSTLKNKDFKNAKKGNYDDIKKNMLNPYAEAFISAVKKYRPQLEDETAFKGAIFTANQAVANGMIDGIKSFSAVIERAVQLGRNQKIGNSSLKTTTHMEFTKLQAALGIDTSIEMQDGFASFSQEQMEVIEAALPEPVIASTEKPSLKAAEEVPAENPALTAIQAQITQMTDLIGKQQAAIESLSTKATTSQTAVNASGELIDDSSSPELSSARKALADFNKACEVAAQTGDYPFS